MKFPMFLTALLLPAIVMAQQPGDKAKTAPPADTAPLDYRVAIYTATSPQYQVVLPRDGTFFTGDNLYASPERAKVRVNLNLRNAPLKEAIKQLSEQTKDEFVLESDVPAGARVTVVAKNIRLSTALDMLTDATDLKWNQRAEIKWKQQATKKPTPNEARITYHIGKNVTSNQQNIPWSTLLNSSQDNYYLQGNRFNFTTPSPNKNLKLYSPYETLPNKNDAPSNSDVTPLLKGKQKPDGNTSLTPKTPSLSVNQPNYVLTTKPSDFASLLSSTLQQGNTLVSSVNLTEVRSTFTCPHCKNQITVIHKHESPKCEKCGRVFHDDWQFCPFDGAKRPASTDTDWQFCPICGERIKPDGKADTKPEAKPNTNNARGGN